MSELAPPKSVVPATLLIQSVTVEYAEEYIIIELHQDVVEKRFGFCRVTKLPGTRNPKTQKLAFLAVFTQIRKKKSIKIR